jgi:hypothetical protein
MPVSHPILLLVSVPFAAFSICVSCLRPFLITLMDRDAIEADHEDLQGPKWLTMSGPCQMQSVVGWGAREVGSPLAENLVRHELCGDHLAFNSFAYHRLSARVPSSLSTTDACLPAVVDVRNARYKGVDKHIAPDPESANIQTHSLHFCAMMPQIIASFSCLSLGFVGMESCCLRDDQAPASLAMARLSLTVKRISSGSFPCSTHTPALSQSILYC